MVLLVLMPRRAACHTWPCFCFSLLFGWPLLATDFGGLAPYDSVSFWLGCYSCVVMQSCYGSFNLCNIQLLIIKKFYSSLRKYCSISTNILMCYVQKLNLNLSISFRIYHEGDQYQSIMKKINTQILKKSQSIYFLFLILIKSLSSLSGKVDGLGFILSRSPLLHHHYIW